MKKSFLFILGILFAITSVLVIITIINEKPPTDHMLKFYTPTISKLKYTILYTIFYLIFMLVDYFIAIITLGKKTIFKDSYNKQLLDESFGKRIFISLLVINIGIISDALYGFFLLICLIPFYITHFTKYLFLILFIVIEIISVVLLKKNKPYLFKVLFDLNIINVLFIICYFLVAVFTPTPLGF